MTEVFVDNKAVERNASQQIQSLMMRVTRLEEMIYDQDRLIQILTTRLNSQEKLPF